MDKRTGAVRRRLNGETQQQIADALGVCRQRVPQLLAESLADGQFSVRVEVTGARLVNPRAVTDYLRDQLNAAGIRAE